MHEALSWVKTNASIDGALPGPLSDTEAWRLIRGAAADEKIRLRGTREERSGANAAWDAAGDAGLILPEKVEALWPVGSSDGSLELVNEAKAKTMRTLGLLTHDRFPLVSWTSVTVSRIDLECEFLPRETKQTTASVRTDGGRSVAETKKPKGRDGAAIWEAALVAWPDGMPVEFASAPTRTKRWLMPFLVKMGHVASLQSSSPNPKTFGRALKNYPKKQDN